MTHNYLELCDYGFPSKPRIDLFVEKLKTCRLQIHIDNPQAAKSCDMLKIRPKNRYFSNLAYLALCPQSTYPIEINTNYAEGRGNQY